MKLIVVLIIVLLSFNAKSFANQNIAGKQYPIIMKNNSVQSRIYFFYNNNGCQSCVVSIEQLAKKIIIKNDLVNKIEVVIFIYGIDDDRVKLLNSQYNKYNIKIISDLVGAYFKLYDIEENNLYLILTDQGNIIKKGRISDFELNLEELINSEKNSVKASYLKDSTSITIKKRNNVVSANRYIHGIFSEKLNKYYFFDSNTKKIYVSNCDGEIDSSFSIARIMNPSACLCFGCSWLDNEKIILFNFYCVSNSPNYTDNVVALKFDIDSNTLTKVNLDYSKIQNSERLIIYGNPLTKGYSIISHYSLSEHGNDLQQLKPLNEFDSNGVKVSSTGQISSIYGQNGLYKYYDAVMCFSKDTKYFFQVYDKVLQVYDRKGNYIDSIELQYGSEFRHCNVVVKDTMTNMDWIKYMSNVSLVRNIIIDTTNNQIMTIIENDIIPPDALDPFAPTVKRSYIMNLFDFKGKKISEPVELDIDYPKVIYFNNGSVAFYHTTNNVANIKWYNIIYNGNKK